MISSNQLSQDRKKVSSYEQGGIAKGCGAVMKKKMKNQKKLLEKEQ